MRRVSVDMSNPGPAASGVLLELGSRAPDGARSRACGEHLSGPACVACKACSQQH